MAATKQHLKAIEAGNITSKGKKKRTQQQAKAVGKDDAPQTRRDAQASPEELAALLSLRALEGNLESARLLLKMTNSTKPIKPAKKKQHGLTYAQRLALDPLWQADPDLDFREAEEPQP
jgi:hypothetical protein